MDRAQKPSNPYFIKGKDFPLHTVKVYRGCRDTAPLILDLDTCWRWVVNLMSQLLYSWVRSLVPEAEWAPEHVWTFCSREKISCPYRNSNPQTSSSLPSRCTVCAVLAPIFTLFSCFKCLFQWKSCWRSKVQQTTIQWTRTSPSSLWVYSVYWVPTGIIC